MKEFVCVCRGLLPCACAYDMVLVSATYGLRALVTCALCPFFVFVSFLFCVFKRPGSSARSISTLSAVCTVVRSRTAVCAVRVGVEHAYNGLWCLGEFGGGAKDDLKESVDRREWQIGS